MLYAFVFLKTIYWLCYYELFFGTDSIVYTNPSSAGILKDSVFLLHYTKWQGLGLYFILGTGILSLLGFFFRKPYFIVDFLIWFFISNLNNKIYPALTGGDYLLNQFLFFNCFLSLSFRVNGKWQDALKICLHNMAIVAVMIQVCLVYFLSALAKLDDPEWLGGNAIVSVSQIRHFSLYAFLNDDVSFKPLFVFLNYFVLVYQLLFPLFVWIGKLKKFLLITGVLMHVYIALVMGLVEFGAIMILAYVYFWPVKRSVP